MCAVSGESGRMLNGRERENLSSVCCSPLWLAEYVCLSGK